MAGPGGPDQVRILLPQRFGQQEDPVVLIRDRVLQRFFYLIPAVDQDPLHACQPHTRKGVGVVADEIHFHSLTPAYRLPMIIKEMISP